MDFQPFTRAAQPFSIGLAPVDAQHFLHVDNQRDRYLAEKRDMYERMFDDVFRAEDNTIDAQSEALAHIRAALGDPLQVDPLLSETSPLAAAGLLVQDDLVLMRKDERGWRLVAASLCFPSSWSLAEKFGLPMEEVHAPVPGMEGKMSARINRIFDALRPDTPLWRENWTFEGDCDLRHERSMAVRSPTYKEEKLQGPLWLRTEYQTLHKLPVSGTILFTILILSRSLEEIAATPAGPQVMSSLLSQYENMSPAERGYKGIDKGAEKLMAWLRDHSGESQPAQP